MQISRKEQLLCFKVVILLLFMYVAVQTNAECIYFSMFFTEITIYFCMPFVRQRSEQTGVFSPCFASSQIAAGEHAWAIVIL